MRCYSQSYRTGKAPDVSVPSYFVDSSFVSVFCFALLPFVQIQLLISSALVLALALCLPLPLALSDYVIRPGLIFRPIGG